ncbi:hypothetical protein LXL04_015362 [Taraxacum kok-saghyz]
MDFVFGIRDGSVGKTIFRPSGMKNKVISGSSTNQSTDSEHQFSTTNTNTLRYIQKDTFLEVGKSSISQTFNQTYLELGMPERPEMMPTLMQKTCRKRPFAGKNRLFEYSRLRKRPFAGRDRPFAMGRKFTQNGQLSKIVQIETRFVYSLHMGMKLMYACWNEEKLCKVLRRKQPKVVKLVSLSIKVDNYIKGKKVLRNDKHKDSTKPKQKVNHKKVPYDGGCFRSETICM